MSVNIVLVCPACGSIDIDQDVHDPRKLRCAKCGTEISA